MADKTSATESSPPSKTSSPLPESADVKPAEAEAKSEEAKESPERDSEADEPSEKPANNKDDDADDDDKSAAGDDVEMEGAKDSAAKRATSPEAKDASDNEDAIVSPVAGQESFKTPVRAGDKNRRKSAVGSAKPSAKKAAARATLTNLDAQPGQQFLVKLKGFPLWPVIIADEDMLPEALINTRPVSAKKPDGTWNEPFVDGGKRVHERKLPIMYLHTNEFGWTQNTMLQPLDTEKAEEELKHASKMKKDLKIAFELATEVKPLSYYKDLIQSSQQALAKEQEMEAARARTVVSKAKARKSKGGDGDGDLDMPDDQPEEESDGVVKKSKKRKADDVATTPQRSDSIKKPKIKLTATPKAPLIVDKSASKEPSKDLKVKLKKTKDEKKEAAAKAAAMTPEEKKRRDVFFLRHRLQRGLLMKEAGPKVEEMSNMSEHLSTLENQYADLEVTYIRETKINKVLKAIIKLDEIPRDDEFKLRERSVALLEKWNKALAVDSGDAPSNGVHGKENGGNASGSKDVEMPDRTKEDAKAVEETA